MSPRDVYAQKKLEAKELKFKIDKLSEELELKNKEVHEAALEICWKENLLSQIRWKFDTVYSFDLRRDTVCLTGITRGHGHTELHKLFETDYHCRTSLTFNTDIRFDDGEITLVFKGGEELAQFIKERGLQVDLSNLYKLKAEHQTSIKTNQERVAQYENAIAQIRQLMNPEDLDKDYNKETPS